MRSDDLRETQPIDDRDRAEDAAGKLANAVGQLLGVEIGEHSNTNCPWDNALAALERALTEPHVVDLRTDGWTVQHPLACRPNLFACPVNRAAERDLTERPSQAPGQYVCALNADGLLEIGARRA